MTWVAVAIGGSALVGAGASYLGSKKQSDASKAAANLQMDQFGVLNRQQQPFIQSGYGAMGRLNTLLGLNPNPNAPRMSSPLTSPGQGYMPTGSGGVRPIAQVDPSLPGRDPRSGFIGVPERAPNARLNQLLALRAQNGDTEAARMLGLV